MKAEKEKKLSLSRKEKPATQANKQNFYNAVLDEAEKLNFESASGVEGIDDEITILRMKIRSVLEKDPENLGLLMEATNMLAKLVKIRYNISKEQKKGLGEAIKNVIKDIGIPLGVAILNKKL